MASDKSLAESDVERVLADADPRTGTLLADATPTTVTPNTDEFSAAERDLIRQRLGM